MWVAGARHPASRHRADPGPDGGYSASCANASREIAAPGAEERLRGGRVEGAREQEALAAVAVLVLQEAQLVLALDALGERLDRHRLAELHERADQRLAFGALRQARDERAVDLQRVDRKLLQMGERGVAGAEVVDRDADPELLDGAQPADRLLGVAHDRRLGDLKRQRARLPDRSSEAPRGRGSRTRRLRAAGPRR